ncbi:hypothetical protein E3P99_01352 [Wallemia hederae]|uniref:rRNA-processing protein FYV7 n=1 Tax=Wallemia hederae TaxID=1540922 RepID=A0A4T0FR10_9BASI|nr:hypothetical protein E3P99_01352 [Wallemia hederae]
MYTAIGWYRPPRTPFVISLIITSMPESSKSQQDRKGFSVARRAGKGSYTGKASKIKEQLIQKAKVKKEYANMLKKEGKPVQAMPEIPRGKKTAKREDDKVDKGAHSKQQQQQQPKQSKHTQPQQQPQAQKKDPPSQRKRKRDQFSKNNNNQPHMRARMENMLDKVKKTVS